MLTHYLKTVNPYFQAIWDLKKLFDVRKNDRDFKVGDKLILLEYDPAYPTILHRQITTSIMYILDSPNYCKEGYVILQLSQLSLKGCIERMQFSDRHFAEKEFEKWCEETGALNCASSVFGWLTDTPEGKEVLKKLCKEALQ